MKFFKLIDKENYNMVIKADGRKQYRYIYGKDEWIRTGLLLEYHSEKSSKYDLYEEISEEEACKIIEIQRTQYNVMYQEAINATKNNFIERKWLHDFVVAQGGFGDVEIDIVALLYCLGDGYYQVIKMQDKYSMRIMISLRILCKRIDYSDEAHLVELRTNTSAHDIIKKVIEKEYSSGALEREKYELLNDYFENSIFFLNNLLTNPSYDDEINIISSGI